MSERRDPEVLAARLASAGAAAVHNFEGNKHVPTVFRGRYLEPCVRFWHRNCLLAKPERGGPETFAFSPMSGCIYETMSGAASDNQTRCVPQHPASLISKSCFLRPSAKKAELGKYRVVTYQARDLIDLDTECVFQPQGSAARDDAKHFGPWALKEASSTPRRLQTLSHTNGNKTEYLVLHLTFQSRLSRADVSLRPCATRFKTT